MKETSLTSPSSYNLFTEGKKIQLHPINIRHKIESYTTEFVPRNFDYMRNGDHAEVSSEFVKSL
jgi:hypothetical protein